MSIRLGFIAYCLDRPQTGISRYTAELAQALAGSYPELELTLLTAGLPEGLAGGNGWHYAPLYGCRLLPGLITLGNLMVPQASRRSNLDLIHDPTGVAPFLFGAAGAKVVITLHDVFPWSYPGTSTLLDTLIYRYWLPLLITRVDAVITDSQASQADIVRYLKVPIGNTYVIPLGVNSIYKPASNLEVEIVRKKHHLPDNYLLFVGSVEKRKNLYGLLRAFAGLREKRDPGMLVIVGVKPKDNAILQLLEDLGLRKQVRFTGYVPEGDLPAIYCGAALFAFPSFYEGFGLPVLEAMACGTPVVTSNVASLPEVAGEAVVFVDPNDVDGIAEAMSMVLADRSLAEELRTRGLKRARQFTWDRTAQETLQVYRRVLG